MSLDRRLLLTFFTLPGCCNLLFQLRNPPPRILQLSPGFIKTLPSRLKFLLQRNDQLDQPLPADPPVSHILLQCLDSVQSRLIINPTKSHSPSFRDWIARNLASTAKTVVYEAVRQCGGLGAD